jgi:hypothetical protein
MKIKKVIKTLNELDKKRFGMCSFIIFSDGSGEFQYNDRETIIAFDNIKQLEEAIERIKTR